MLKPRQERELSADQVIASLRPKMAQVPGLKVFLVNQPPINVGGRGTRSLYQFTLQDTDTDSLYHWAPIFEEKIRELPGLQDVSSDLQLRTPQVSLDFDRDRISTLGLTANQVENRALQRLRHTAGLADLRAEQPVPGGHAGRAGVPARSEAGVVDALRPFVEPAGWCRSTRSRASPPTPGRCR